MPDDDRKRQHQDDRRGLFFWGRIPACHGYRRVVQGRADHRGGVQIRCGCDEGRPESRKLTLPGLITVRYIG